MKDEQPKSGLPGQTSKWHRWEDPAEISQDSYLQGPDGQKRADKGADGVRPADALIAGDVHRQLVEDAFLDPASLTVTVEHGKVLLEGYVAQFADRERAGEMALDIEGVTACRNNLRIAPERH